MTSDCGRWRDILHMVVGLGIILGVLAWVASESWGMLISVHAAVLVVGITVGGLWLSFGPGPVLGAVRALVSANREVVREAYAIYLHVFARAYQLAWAAAVVSVLVGAIFMLRSMDDPARIGPSMAVALLGLLYGALLAEFLFGPLHQVLANRAIQWELNLPAPIAPPRSMLVIGAAVGFGALLLTLILALTLAPH